MAPPTALSLRRRALRPPAVALELGPRIKGLVSFYAETLDALTLSGSPAPMQRV